MILDTFWPQSGHLERCQMPDIENRRKTAERTTEWVPGKVPGKQPKNRRKRAETAGKQLFCLFWLLSGCFSAVFQHVTRNPLKLFFSAVFRLCSMSGIALDGHRHCHHRRSRHVMDASCGFQCIFRAVGKGGVEFDRAIRHDQNSASSKHTQICTARSE